MNFIQDSPKTLNMPLPLFRPDYPFSTIRASLVGGLASLLLVGCVGTMDSWTPNEPEGTGTQIQHTRTADTDSSITQRPRHIALTPDTATPWWALVASWEATEATDVPWNLDEARGDLTAEADPEMPVPNVDDTDNSSDNPLIDQAEAPIDSSAEAGDLWQRMRSGFTLEGENHRFVRPYIEWYAEHQAYLDRVVERARPFLFDIVQEIEARGMPMEIALLPVVESAFQPFAYSPGRAAGIWQFIPATGKRYGLKQNWWYDGRRDVRRSTQAALDYLQRLSKRFDGDWLLALASYNSGEGRVARAVEKNRKKGRPTDFWSLDLPDETQGYVPKLLAISAIINNADNYGITLASISDEPYLERVNIGSQIDLALAAELADLPIETLYQLNPAYNRWATAPKGPHKLLLPIDKADAFREALAKVDKKDRVRWERHRIREGETLGHIARKYQTTVAMLQEVNNIRDKWIRAGQSIIIPVATKNLKHYMSEDRRRQALQSTKRSGYKIQHTVKRGDSFWDISRKYKVEVSQLARWNGMSPKDSLMPGQKLVIWSKSRNLASRKFVSLPRSVTQQQVHYRVRKGDSLALIAQKFSVTVSKLRHWNSLKKGKYLQPGQKLTLYVDVTQQS
jgi:membrane-bound lytic murein transglycosylase D